MSINESFFVTLFLLISLNIFSDREDKLRYRNDCIFKDYLLKNNFRVFDSLFFDVFRLSFFYLIVFICNHMKNCFLFIFKKYYARPTDKDISDRYFQQYLSEYFYYFEV